MTPRPPARPLTRGIPPAPGRLRRGGPAWCLLWGIAAVAAAGGLTRLRVSNSLSGWSPGHGPSRGLDAYLVLGMDAGSVDAAEIERGVSRLPAVGRCFGPASEPALRLLGITPETLTRSADGRYVGVWCFAKDGPEGAAMHTQVARLLESIPHAADKVAVGGSAAFTAALDDISQRRMPAILTGITLLGGLLLRHITGSTRAAAHGVAAILVSLACVLGAAGWCRVPVDMSLLLVPPLMISLGYSYAAHAAMRRDATRALVACGITSTLGVAAFGAADLPSIRAFAAWGTAGVIVVWAAVLTLTPAPTGPPLQGVPDRWARARLLPLLRRRPAAIAAAALLVGLAGPALAPSLDVEAQPLRYFADTERIRRDEATLERRLTGMLPFEVQAPRDDDPRPALERCPLIRKVIDVSPIAGGPGRTFWCLADNDSLDALDPLFASWESGDAPARVVRGVAPQLLEVRRQMRAVAASSLPCMLAVSFIATALLGRSWRAGLAGLLATLTPVAALLLLARTLGWTIQMPALMTGAIAIGAGIDDAMHIVWLRRRSSLPRTFRTCFRACVGSSAIAALCMLAFAASPFRPTAQFGLLMALTLALAALADMLVLPVIMGTGASGAGRTAPACPAPNRPSAPPSGPARRLERASGRSDIPRTRPPFMDAAP